MRDCCCGHNLKTGDLSIDSSWFAHSSYCYGIEATELSFERLIAAVVLLIFGCYLLAN